MAKSEDLIKNLVALPHEYEWLDFKESWFSKDEIGEYIFPAAKQWFTEGFTKRFAEKFTVKYIKKFTERFGEKFGERFGE